jgi:hypothetical protein
MRRSVVTVVVVVVVGGGGDGVWIKIVVEAVEI